MSATHNSTPEDEAASTGTAASIGSSAALISIFVIISRITGFMRTWAMAFALGSTMLASSYQIANNLPNMLYELVMGGMLVTAFLPVYLSVKNKLGDRGGNEYAGNIMSIAFIALGLVALFCTLFAPALVFTQSFMNDQAGMDDAVFFFRFFAIQIVFYGLSSIVSGLLNASRDYLWSSAAPIFNNIIVTATFVLYAFVAPVDAEAAKVVIAVGNPLGVFVQMAIQLPALKRNGIKLRFHVDLRDPALKETLAIGVPAVLVMCAGLVVVSVQNAASYAAADNGPSVIAYARLWFTLPYAFLTVPITTALFTEISEMHTKGDTRGFKRGLASGTSQIVFFMAPFALYLVVFAEPLVTLYHIGAFTEDNIAQIALYLAALAPSLPFYGVNTYLQKAFSAMRAMKRYSVMMAAAIALQVGFIAVFGTPFGGPLYFGMPAIALSETVFYLVLDIACFVYLRRALGPLGLRGVMASSLRSLLLGAAGACAGGAVSFVLQATLFPLDGSIMHALGCIVCGGLTALAVTFGIAAKAGFDEAAMLSGIVGKAAGRLRRTAPSARAGEEAAEAAEIATEPLEPWSEPAFAPAADADGARGESRDAESAPGRRGEHLVGERSGRADDEDGESTSLGRHSAHAVAARKIARARHAMPAGPVPSALITEGDAQRMRAGKHGKPASASSLPEYRTTTGAKHSPARAADASADRARHASPAKFDAPPVGRAAEAAPSANGDGRRNARPRGMAPASHGRHAAAPSGREGGRASAPSHAKHERRR